MLGTQTAVIEGSTPLLGFLGASIPTIGQENPFGGAFTEELEQQLGDLLVELGLDPAQLEGMEVEGLLAHLQALLNGSLTTTQAQPLPLEALGELNLTATEGEHPRTEVALATLELLLQTNPQDASERHSGFMEELQAQLHAWLSEHGYTELAEQLQATERPEALVELLRPLLAPVSPEGVASASTADAEEANQPFQAYMRQLLQRLSATDPSSLTTPDTPEVDEAADLITRLRALLGQGGTENHRLAHPEAGLTKPISALFAQAFSEQTAALDPSGKTPVSELSATEALSLLRASIASRPESAPNTQSGSPAFDLARLLTPDGARQMAEQLAQIARTREGMAEIKLRPASLGAMEVRVVMEADKAHVHFVSPNAAVRELLEAALPRLREALAQDGLALGNASVSDQPPQGRDQASGAGAHSGDNHTEEEDELAQQTTDGPTLANTLSALTRKLDLFA